MEMLEHVTRHGKGEEKELAFLALESKGKKRLNCCLQLCVGVITEAMRIDLSVHSDRAGGHAAACANPSG